MKRKLLITIALGTATFCLYSCEKRETNGQHSVTEEKATVEQLCSQKIKEEQQSDSESITALNIPPQQYDENLLKEVRCDNRVRVQQLLQAGANINTTDNKGNTALHIAAKLEYPEMLELLLQHPGIDIHKKNQDELTPIMSVIVTDNVQLLQILLQHANIDLNEGEITPLITAVQSGSANAVQLLLQQKNVDVNKTMEGVSPLLFAIADESPEIVRLLLQRADININSSNGDGVSPLSLAIAYNDSAEILRHLLQCADIDVNAACTDGLTPLQLAISVQSTEKVQLLLQHKHINVNKRDSDGVTPLEFAMLFGNRTIIRLLRNSGAR